jgi:hypothetical protein
VVEDVAHRGAARVRGVDEREARAEAARERAHVRAPVAAVREARDVDRARDAERVRVRAHVRGGAVQVRPRGERA